jgi:DNA-binding NtrC family response regulator
VISTSTVTDALDALKELKNKGEVVAVFISDQRMPEMNGVTFSGTCPGNISITKTSTAYRLFRYRCRH